MRDVPPRVAAVHSRRWLAQPAVCAMTDTTSSEGNRTARSLSGPVTGCNKGTYVRILGLVIYLGRRDTRPAATWWAELEGYASAAPGIVRELLRGSSVVCDPTGAELPGMALDGSHLKEEM
jgi:hypothetical protein